MGSYTLQKTNKTCLGTDKEKNNCILSHSTFIYRVYPGSLKASLMVTVQMTYFSQWINKHMALTFKFWGLCISWVQEWSSQISCCWQGDVDALLGITWFISLTLFWYLLIIKVWIKCKKTLLAQMLCSSCLRSFMREFGCLMSSNSKRKIKVLCTASFCQVLRWGLGESVTETWVFESHTSSWI